MSSFRLARPTTQWNNAHDFFSSPVRPTLWRLTEEKGADRVATALLRATVRHLQRLNYSDPLKACSHEEANQLLNTLVLEEMEH